MEWFRWYHGSVSDPKFRLLAKLADAKLTEVLAVWQAMLEHASQSSQRGSLEGWRDDVTAVCLDMDANAIERIRTQANNVGLIANADDGIEFLASWEKRQPKREDGSAERAKAWREQKKSSANANEQKRTQKNTEQNRTEQNREEENTLSAPAEATAKAPEDGTAPKCAQADDTTPEKCRDGSPVAYAMIVQGGGQVRISEKQVAEWEKAFPSIPVKSELFRIQTWSQETTDPERWKKKEAFMATCNLLAKKNTMAMPHNLPKPSGRIPHYI